VGGIDVVVFLSDRLPSSTMEKHTIVIVWKDIPVAVSLHILLLERIIDFQRGSASRLIFFVSAVVVRLVGEDLYSLFSCLFRLTFYILKVF
jgi:uncharacterized membrane protein